MKLAKITTILSIFLSFGFAISAILIYTDGIITPADKLLFPTNIILSATNAAQAIYTARKIRKGTN